MAPMAVFLAPPLMAPQALILRNPNPRTRLSPPAPTSLSLRRALSFPRPLRPKFNLSASYSPPPPPIPAPKIPILNTIDSPLTGSTRTITTIFSIALSLAKLLALKLKPFVPLLTNPNTTPLAASGPLFFAVIGGDLGVGPRSSGAPIAVIASGMARWLEIYSCVLLIRVLLSWFPNMPWDKQPLSAVRDLCDPYLSLFRGIIPPLFNSLDVSPILAFLLLGMLGQLVRTPRS